ncbi:MAG: hypothetical protein IJ361_09035 [Spirochaetaceae bacterium]|nr:hypothetical protein [Spirochaetaceae bacterium]
MKKTFKVVALLLLVLVTSTFVFAQSSNTFTATAETLRDDADNFMDVRYFNEVDFSNFFVWTDLSLDEANLGFAKKFDALYLGAYYKGDLWDGSSDKTTTENTTNVTKNITGDHKFDLLFGFSGMAFKLDTSFKLYNTKENDVDTENEYESESKTNNSTYTFGLTWGGLSVPAGNANLRPWAKIAFEIKDATVYSEVKTGDTTVVTTDKTNTNNLNTLSVTLASDAEWGSKDAFFSVAGLAYTLETAIGANGVVYEVTDGENTSSTTRAGKQDISNIFSPYYRFEYKVSDNLKFGGRVGANLAINTSCDGYTYDPENPPEVPDLEVTTATSISSNLGLGMQYKLKPNFAMNLGLKADLPRFDSTKTVTPVGEDSESKNVVSDVNSSFSSNLYTGFVWDINENCALDAYMSIPLNPSILMDILGGGLSLGFKYKM